MDVARVLINLGDMQLLRVTPQTMPKTHQPFIAGFTSMHWVKPGFLDELILLISTLLIVGPGDYDRW